MPTMICGSTAGMTTCRKSFLRETPKLAAARRYWRSMACTPAVVCTTIGKTAARKIRNIGDALPTPNHRIARGIQAMGEMGRSTCTMGFTVS
jgi:hypothetical protein